MATRTQVRNQLTQFLQAGDYTSVNQIFPSFPKRINFQINSKAGQKSRAAAVVFIEDEVETRIALGGAKSGVKRIDYSVAVQLFHHSMENNAEDAMTDFDQCIDELKTQLRSDHQFGDTTGLIVFQGAEPALDVVYGEPVSNEGGATETWAAIRFQVSQIFNA
jgi:hypothetical protein